MRDSAKIKEKVRRLPHTPGVYLMKDRLGSILYVGKAKDLKKRVSTYFQPSRRLAIAQPKVRSMLDLIADLETIEVHSEAEALLLEGRLIKQYRPRYNTDFTDDKRFLLIRVDVRSPVPRFRLARNRLNDGALYFGPFAHAGSVRKTLLRMRREFGIVLGDAHPDLMPGGRVRLYDDARGELYGHENEISLDEYRQRVERACAFLGGQADEWIRELEKRMKELAEARRFEEAAHHRDLLFALRKTISQTRRFERLSLHRGSAGPDGQAALKDCLGLETEPVAIECFDISHISGTFTVASMVRFVEGRPDRRGFRRFRIRSFEGNDDFRAMEEVVGRRYLRLREEGSDFPGLVVIDGGKGQVAAALRAFLLLDIEPPPLVGLAKKRETIIFPDERPPLQLDLHDPALRLLQRIRDEAHRFANAFSAELRSKRIRDSVLDEIPGLGPVRRGALLDAFGSVRSIREADPADLAKVQGIGRSFARRIHAHLTSGDPNRECPE